MTKEPDIDNMVSSSWQTCYWFKKKVCNEIRTLGRLGFIL